MNAEATNLTRNLMRTLVWTSGLAFTGSLVIVIAMVLFSPLFQNQGWAHEQPDALKQRISDLEFFSKTVMFGLLLWCGTVYGYHAVLLLWIRRQVRLLVAAEERESNGQG